MAAQQKPEPGTDVALSNASVGVLPPEIQQALELRKLQNQVAGQLAGMNWGKSLDHATRRAIADWGRQMHVDVTTEIDVLGSNIYLNSRFYLRRLGELIRSGIVEYAYADHVEPDDRLAKLGDEGEREAMRRTMERIKHQIPDKSVSSVVFRIKLRSMTEEIVGAKWCGGGTRKNDPVGEQFPVESSESRAARRAIRQIVSHIPSIASDVLTVEEAADEISDRISDARAQFRASEAAINAPPPGRTRAPAVHLPLKNPDDPYSAVDEARLPEIESREAVRVEAGSPTDAQRAAAELAAQQPDPFGDELELKDR